MAKLLRDQVTGWPRALEVFDPADWGPVPGAVLQSCRCAGCVGRWGAALPPDDSMSVGAARRRWRQARIAFLREVLGPDHQVYRLEVLEAIRGQCAPVEVAGVG